ncbi:MAG: copper resistance protein NlpE N-terminal domain-containing protein [Aquaticitalea sp.]
MNPKSIYIIFLAMSLFLNCKDEQKNEEDIMTPDMETMGDNSMTSLDWDGTYEGFLPCADCEGIKTTMTISTDNTYMSREIYQGKSDSIFEKKGTFKWDDKGQKITFSDKNRHSYFVGENMLIHLDKDGDRISGDLANKYILTKSEEQLVGKKWHLVSFKGNETQLEEAKAERPNIEFMEDGTMSGYTGCNQFRGAYLLKEGHKIKFSQIISTKKFCPEMESENEFLNTMGKANYYKFEDQVLVIHDKHHKALATFKVAN